MSGEFIDYLKDLFEPVSGVSFRRMFGGHGIFRQGLMFALVADDVLYLKADAVNDSRFTAEGCEPFVYQAKTGKQTVMSYWRAPERLFDDPEGFVEWAEDAFQAALRADAEKPPSQRKWRG